MFAADVLKGKVALITGGGGGIGLEIATAYARLGAKVVVASRNQERLDGAVASLAAQGLEILAVQTDVRVYEQIRDAIETAVERYGALDILVNNAAGNFHCPTAELSPNGWKTVIDIDLNGTFYGCHAAYKHLKAARDGGCIISIATMLGLSGWPGAAHAGAAKAGIISLSRALAVEWGGDNIRVNTISPGPIGDTEGVRRLYQETGREQLERKKTALGRFGNKSDIANAAVYLASDLGAYITGENMVVDGGRWLKYVAA
ncbi:short-chain dehydrogenase [Achromobacter xylosoxidans]|jgi:NAD(P)-dependent dehydrogenase (short-subunit alcohol dehydrogenase family)|uniref:Short-chain dehydrogenase n=2 Tax=Achromobacter TaxID=222 RepID=A0A1R1JZQ6_ALCXX|nr:MULTISPECIES: glucose 1-dehydrogenase [Achromobacter]AZS81006.1 glucose 1-dehydrogenase [Achromobacter spanius]OFS37270.1 short-chain dehydrogenase [Achromobacter xylosoxidans]OMG92624.1 short-chain dehydrogenase [Achromobacter xylosoxidans]CAB3630201.1 putative 2,4-dienoyl-CoA reductase [Achromobacter insuavis]CAB3833518.1 putative 2,4-dienoyl-CoA reductase [Achromobacter deleyi]